MTHLIQPALMRKDQMLWTWTLAIHPSVAINPAEKLPHLCCPHIEEGNAQPPHLSPTCRGGKHATTNSKPRPSEGRKRARKTPEETNEDKGGKGIRKARPKLVKAPGQSLVPTKLPMSKPVPVSSISLPAPAVQPPKLNITTDSTRVQSMEVMQQF